MLSMIPNFMITPPIIERIKEIKKIQVKVFENITKFLLYLRSFLLIINLPFREVINLFLSLLSKSVINGAIITKIPDT